MIVLCCTAGPAPGVQLLFPPCRSATWEANSERELGGRKQGLSILQRSLQPKTALPLTHKEITDVTLHSQPLLSPKLQPSGHQWRRVSASFFIPTQQFIGKLVLFDSFLPCLH